MPLLARIVGAHVRPLTEPASSKSELSCTNALDYSDVGDVACTYTVRVQLLLVCVATCTESSMLDELQPLGSLNTVRA